MLWFMVGVTIFALVYQVVLCMAYQPIPPRLRGARSVEEAEIEQAKRDYVTGKISLLVYERTIEKILGLRRDKYEFCD